MDESAEIGTVSELLDPKQSRLLAALLTERSVENAAKKANIGRSTAYQMLRDPVFIEALKASERQVLEQTLRGLLTLSQSALGVFAHTLEDKRASAATKLRAADSVISNILKLHEVVSLEARIAALEERAGEPYGQ